MRILGKYYQIIDNTKTVKSKILLAATKLFALNGYGSVSVRQIAESSGIHHRTIYRHYPGKQAILEEMLERCGQELSAYYGALDKANREVESLEGLVDNLFVELRKMNDPFSYYALSVAMSTQFQFERSRELFYGCFLTEGRQSIKRQLDRAVSRGLAAPVDTASLASLISSAVITTNNIRLGFLHGYYQDFDFEEWYDSQAAFVLATLRGGTPLPPD